MAILRRNRTLLTKELPVESKTLVTSKTFWVNMLGGTVSVLTALGSISFLPVSWAPYIVGALAVVNVLLRVVTDQPISGVVSAK